MTDAILTPFVDLATERVGRRRFWKQILPVKSIDYDGQKIDFDPKFHQDLELAFKDRAFDQVPLVFADSNNAHNMDPRNFGGDIIDLQYRGDGPDQGTWALIEADRQAARVINRNPKLGVSARILQGVKRDGKNFARAVNHVLLTMNPRVTGMSPWQAVDLSEGTDIETVDLTAEQFTEGTDMAKTATAKATRRQIDLSKLNDDQFATLIDLATATGVLDKEDEVEDEDLEGLEDEVDDEDEVVEPPRRKKSSKTKITVEKESDEPGEDDDEDEDGEDDEDDEVVNLSRTVAAMQEEAAKGKWANERAEYIRQGVPPYMLDLAEPILSKPQKVIDLADGGADAASAMRKMLNGATGLVDLTGEMGHGLDLSENLADNDPDAKFLAAWDEQY